MQAERRRRHARALEECTHSGFEVLRQRLHGSWGRDPACEDPLFLPPMTFPLLARHRRVFTSHHFIRDDRKLVECPEGQEPYRHRKPGRSCEHQTDGRNLCSSRPGPQRCGLASTGAPSKNPLADRSHCGALGGGQRGSPLFLHGEKRSATAFPWARTLRPSQSAHALRRRL